MLICPTLTEDHSVEALKDCKEVLETEHCQNNGPLAPEEEFLQSLHHVSSKLKCDLSDACGLKGKNLTRHDARVCIPNSLYTLLEWILSGCKHEDDDTLAEY